MSYERDAISALIPVRDGVAHLPNLRLQLERTLLPHDEIIIVNDGSLDSTWEYLNSWSRLDSRIHLIDNKNLGISNALNLGIALSSNDWLARFDVDDIYHPDRISNQLQEIKSQTVAVFSDYSFRTSAGLSLGFVPSALFSSATSVSLISSQRTPHPVAMLNKIAVQSVGGYRQHDFPAEDLSLWLRLSREGELVSSPFKLLEYTLNPKGVSSSKRRLQLSKKQSLLTSIGVNYGDYNEVRNNFFAIVEKYNCHPDSIIRALLLFRELSTLAQIQNQDVTSLKKHLFKDMTPLNLLAISQFFIPTAVRKVLRYLSI